jgi:cyclopropane fatty-acyl-phospholipid synthase-like methyltransferase
MTEGRTTSATEHLERVRNYYDSANQTIQRYIGATYQAGLVKTDAGDAPAESNRVLAARAGIKPGNRILDAGCGAGGPSLDIARAFEGVTIDGVTLSPAQAESAREAIERAGLSSRIRIHVGDYHDLRFEPGSFDVVLFLECTTYSYDLRRLFSGVFRVLRPGGGVYVKDVFLKEGTLNEAEQAEIQDFDEMFKLFRTYPMSEGEQALKDSGFADVTTESLDSMMTTDAFIKAMFEFDKRGQPVLNDFGKLHFRTYECLPTVYGEMRARKPG